jgi:hypothetical protein
MCLICLSPDRAQNDLAPTEPIGASRAAGFQNLQS